MPRAGLKQKAYREIRQRIVGGEFIPGTVLSESGLVELVGVSRTPVREALSCLEQEGLVRIIPKCGIAVKSLSVQEINALFEMRTILEPYVIRRYADRIPRDQLLSTWRAMERAYMESDAEDQYRLDAQLHRLIHESAANPYINRIMEQAVVENTRIRTLMGTIPSRLKDSYEEHRSIVEALLAERCEDAAAAMEAHLRIAHQLALQKLL